MSPPAAGVSPETLLEFPDNRLLIDLCGPHDSNLAQIENRLGVQIMRRGNQLAIIAEPALQEQAVAVLQALGLLKGWGDIDDPVGEQMALDDLPQRARLKNG